MPRIRAAVLLQESRNAMRPYLQSKLWHWAVQENYTLSTDYAIHLLNHCAKDALGLCVGGLVARLAGQDELASRCDRATERLLFIKEKKDICDLLNERYRVPPEQVRSWRADRLKDIQEGRQIPAEESIAVASSAPMEDLQKAVSVAARRVQKEALVEVLEPQHSPSGRGLYTSKAVAAGTVLLVDEPLVVQSGSRSVCAQCLATVDPSLAVTCRHCEEESYCSSSCRDLAWTASHSCCCISVNTEYSRWAHSAWEVMEKERSRPGAVTDSTSSYRAALACLAVGKLCAMATVAHCHPLELPGLSFLRGVAEYQRSTALSEVGSLAVVLSSALRQPYLFMEEILSLFALLQTNEFLVEGSTALYPVLSLLNHSCVANCTTIGTVRAPAQRQLVALRDLRDGEQLFIDYNSALSTLKYEDRKALCAQRHFTCFCSKCIRKE